VGSSTAGVDYTHPDLAANIWTNPGEIPGNGIDDDGNGFVDDVHGWDSTTTNNDPMDDFGLAPRGRHHRASATTTSGSRESGVERLDRPPEVPGILRRPFDLGGRARHRLRHAHGRAILNNSWERGFFADAG